ncbi:hypothetical protein BS333_18190 [Vibrio azureus]|uniref:Lipid/polyisoprenoid-binding YceI-like domain-containing protein n=1 Tax=Vibrio azureus NBRC 104587 TaxID=1219077 RepID=U3CGM4_9VIBR|nr:YceI family protein [Vibrio azureus]AUI88274.1 hypothetical protein BS333_18190 [Vibrio azureus]GAD77428.1 hypothetical protein VAZ01S_075_00220 [Vibrio azureus NBRC 104587]
MKNIITPISLAYLLFAGHTLADNSYALNPEFSSVNFATIKKQYIIEPATLNTLEGSIDKEGKFELKIELKGIDTGVPIRNTRLQEIFFETVKFPQATVTGKVSLKALSGGPNKMIIPANITLFGHTKTLDFPVVILKTKELMMISSTQPIIINASDFGIPNENLDKLSSTVGNIAISGTVPLSLVLTFVAQ